MPNSPAGSRISWLPDGRLFWSREEGSLVFENDSWVQAECEALCASLEATPLRDSEIADLVFSGILPRRVFSEMQGY